MEVLVASRERERPRRPLPWQFIHFHQDNRQRVQHQRPPTENEAQHAPVNVQ